jgi:hypothetical protein
MAAETEWFYVLVQFGQLLANGQAPLLAGARARGVVVHL